jgi:hemerythrin-like domain-containing protein
MQPTEVLMSEHRVIEQVLNCLERMTDRCAAEGKLDGVSAALALDFLQQFADRCHHGKEEEQLFPMLEARGCPRYHGPTGVMRAEHEEGRRHIRGMLTALAGAAAGDPDAVAEFLTHAEDYIHLLREHIRKEDHCLFPLADDVLADEDRQELLAGFSRMEHAGMGPGTHEKYLGIADELADRWDVPRAETLGGVCPACGHPASLIRLGE